ncbi:MAG TPA: hypothetical protein VKR56_15770 [Candidatus Cybelea sp.]|nr:hypothetical protein [Candidatus Cybelea sp.]
MMTQQLEVSILAAPLAAIDRRALSQAWYSALYLARPDRQLVPSRDCGPCTAATPLETKPEREAEPPSPRPTELRVARSVQTKPSKIAAQPSAPRIPANRDAVPLSLRIERRFAHSASHVKRATFSLGRGEARVHVILQTNGNVATLVALCRPQMRTVVARALAQARFALAARGFVVDVDSRGDRCS